MSEKATYPVAGTIQVHAEHRVWGRAVAARRRLRTGDQSLWAETAPIGYAMIVLCSGTITRIAGRSEAETDPAFVMCAGGSLLLRAETDTVVISVRVPIPAQVACAAPMIVLDDPHLSTPASAFVAALLDAPQPDTAGDAQVERVLSELAVQLLHAAGDEDLG